MKTSLENCLDLHMSYDNTGFKTALSHSESPCENRSYAEIVELFDDLMSDGMYDLGTDNCTSFEIYNEEGKLIFRGSK